MVSRTKLVKATVGSKVFDACNVIFMLILLFLMVYPFWNQLVISLNDGIDAQRGGLYFWPREFTLNNYDYILKSKGLLSALGWSLARVIWGTFAQLVCTGLWRISQRLSSFLSIGNCVPCL